MITGTPRPMMMSRPRPLALRLLLALLPLALLAPPPSLAHSWVFNATWPRATHHVPRRIAFREPSQHIPRRIAFRDLSAAAAAAEQVEPPAQDSASAASAGSGGGGDPCAALHKVLSKAPSMAAGESKLLFVRPKDVVGCTQSVKFDASRDLENLESVFKYLKHFYSLLHIAKHSPDPHFPSQYDVLGALEQLKTREWNSAEEFYNALILGVRGLNDAHTAVRVNCPPFSHMLALPLAVVSRKGKPTVRAAPKELFSAMVTEMAAKKPFKFDALKYAGARVLRINGRGAWASFKEYADTRAGFFHDLGQRINFASASPGGTLGAYNQRLMNPKENFVELELIRRGESTREKVRVPWLSVTDGANLEGFQSTDKYASGFCLAGSDNSLDSNANGWQTLHHRSNQGGQNQAGAGEGRPGRGMREQEVDPRRTILPSANAGGGLGSKAGGAASASPFGGLGMGRRGLLRVRRSAGGAAEAAGQGSQDTGNSTAEGPTGDMQGQGQTNGQGQGQSQGNGNLPTFDYNSPEELQALGSNAAENSAATPSKAPLMRRVQRTPKQLRQLRQHFKERSPYREATVLSDEGDLFPVLLLSDKKTAVVAITTFAPEADNGPPLELFLKGAIKAFKLADGAAKQVLVDLSGNGGGYTQLGPWLAGLLMGTDKYPHPRSTMQADYKQFLADTSFATDMAQKAEGRFDWSSYATPNEKPYTQNNKGSFFFPVKTKRFAEGAPAGKYSSLFKEELRSLTELEGKRFKPILGKKPFALLSDGLCFSTCGTFSTLMTKRFKIKSVTAGGIPGKRLAFSGGGGGFIIGDVEFDMLPMIPDSLAKRKDAPKPFTWSMSMSMRFVHGYFSRGSKAPIEFTWRPGTAQVKYTVQNLADRSLLLLEAARKVF